MTNSDIQGALALFQKLAGNARTLKTQLASLGTQGIPAAQDQALQALAQLAAKGEALLASGASKLRDAEIQAVSSQIQGLQSAIILGGNVEAINERIADLTAKRASLLLEAVGDFSNVISPAKVRALVILAVEVHDAAAKKKQAAQIIALVEQVITSAAEVAGAAAAFA